jgi:putative tricarboxylic transport membrane protein
MKKSNFVIGSIFLLLSAFYYFSTRDLPPPSKMDNLGAAFFPNLLAAVLAVLSLILIIDSLFLQPAASAEDKHGAAIKGAERLEEDAFGAEQISYKTLLPTMILSFLYIILLPLFGYLVVTPVFLLALTWLLGEKWKTNVYASAGLTAALYLLFAVLLGVRLPGGSLFS